MKRTHNPQYEAIAKASTDKELTHCDSTIPPLLLRSSLSRRRVDPARLSV